MSAQTEFRCPACDLLFATDLNEQEAKFCPLCGYRGLEPVTVVRRPVVEDSAEVQRFLADLESELEEAWGPLLRPKTGT
jgi:DNA-directed RNA polymerase subunit RPC12/RpoP